MKSVRICLCFSFCLVFAVPSFAQRFRPLLITLDHNDDFVITGDGQRINGIDFQGPDGAFESAPGSIVVIDDNSANGTAPAPFQFLLANNSRQVTMGIIVGFENEPPEVRGSFPLGFGPTDLSILDELYVGVGFTGRQVIENPLDFVCDGCSYPNLKVTPSGGLEL